MGGRGLSAGAANPAGAITVHLVTRAGRVDAASVSSSRHLDVAQRLFRGRPVEHALATLPMIFSVCATAQACAATAACENASEIQPDPRHLQARELLLLAETAREHLFRILLGWSAWLETPPGVAGLGALGRMRAAWGRALYPAGDAFRPGGGALSPDRGALTGLLHELQGLLAGALGEPPDSWSARWPATPDNEALMQWVESGAAVAPCMLGSVIERGYAGLGGSPVVAMPAIEDSVLAALLAGDAADAFVAAPLWSGAPCETGALQRQCDTPAVAASQQVYGNALLPRLLARLFELVDVVGQIGRLVEQVAPAGAGADLSRADGSGIAQVEAARGRLVHWLRIVDGKIADYRILAPTEWNFHPRGALAQGLLSLPVDDRLPQLARLLVDAIDPCVEASVEVTNDA